MENENDAFQNEKIAKQKNKKYRLDKKFTNIILPRSSVYNVAAKISKHKAPTFNNNRHKAFYLVVLKMTRVETKPSCCKRYIFLMLSEPYTYSVPGPNKLILKHVFMFKRHIHAYFLPFQIHFPSNMHISDTVHL